MNEKPDSDSLEARLKSNPVKARPVLKARPDSNSVKLWLGSSANASTNSNDMEATPGSNAVKTTSNTLETIPDSKNSSDAVPMEARLSSNPMKNNPGLNSMETRLDLNAVAVRPDSNPVNKTPDSIAVESRLNSNGESKW